MVYVDDMYRTALGQYRGMAMSHMVADSDDELPAMADRIGVARRWYQGDHYDVAASKRELALAAGAVPITLRQCAAMCYRRRVTGALGDPATAVGWLHRYHADRLAARGTS